MKSPLLKYPFRFSWQMLSEETNINKLTNLLFKEACFLRHSYRYTWVFVFAQFHQISLLFKAKYIIFIKNNYRYANRVGKGINKEIGKNYKNSWQERFGQSPHSHTKRLDQRSTASNRLRLCP